VWYLLSGRGAGFADDTANVKETAWRADIYSRANYTVLKDSMIAALSAAGFFGIEEEAETYETDTKYFHISISFRHYTELEV
jgi:hypothetical protein